MRAGDLPSTAKQKLLGEALVEEMRALGIADARIDADGYVYGSVPGTPGAPAIGLIAHMDTSPDCSGRDIKPRIVEYTGGDIALNENTVLSPEDFPDPEPQHRQAPDRHRRHDAARRGRQGRNR